MSTFETGGNRKKHVGIPEVNKLFRIFQIQNGNLVNVFSVSISVLLRPRIPFGHYGSGGEVRDIYLFEHLKLQFVFEEFMLSFIHYIVIQCAPVFNSFWKKTSSYIVHI